MSLTARSSASIGQAPSAPLPLVVAGAVGGAAAAIFSYLALAILALAAWMLDPSGAQEWTQMLEVASGAWLAGLGQAPTVSGVTLTLLPLGFAILPLIAVAAASRWAADASAVARRGEAAVVAIAVGVSFAAVGAIVAGMSRNLAISPARTALVAGLVMTAVSTLIVLRRADLISRDALPDQVRDGAAAAGVALLCLVAAASVILAVAIVMSFDEITALLVELDAGAAGLLLLASLTLGYLPVAIVWSLAYLLGPGVTVSVGTVVAPYGDPASAALPGFPLFAVLPDQPPAGALLLPALVVAAGAVAGALLRRRGLNGMRGALVALGAATSASVVLAIAAWLSTGALGDTSLQGLGPAPLLVAGVGGALIAVGAIAVTAWPERPAHV
ncbi:MAG: hypothetical protein RL134_1251 [Actinomycetota bacterium]